MACDLILRTTDFKNEESEIILNQGGFENGSRPNFRQIAEIIVNLDKDKRTKIIDRLLTAKAKEFTTNTLKSGDKNKRVWVSNTDLSSIFDQFPDLKHKFENLPIDIADNYTLISCKKMKINGENRFGRNIDSDGTEIFFINGYYGAQKFLEYLNMKKMIQDNIEDNKLSPILSQYQNDLNIIAEVKKTTPYKILMDYLNSKSSFGNIVHDGKIIIANKVLEGIFHTLNNSYDPNKGKSDLELALNNIKLKHDNKWEYKLNIDSLYNVLKYFNSNIISQDEFLKKSESELNEYLQILFDDDVRLRRLELKSLVRGEEGTTEKYIDRENLKSQQIKDAWKSISDSLVQQGFDPLGKLEDAVKNENRQQLNLLLNAFPNLKNVKLEIVDKTTKKKDGTTGTKKTIRISYDVEKIKTNNPKPSYIVLKTPYKLIGELYDFTYDTQYIFTPVNEGSVENGMYNGAYIYKYYNDKTHTTHYAVSRHILSPKTYMSVYSTLEGAMSKIDNMNNEDIVYEYGLHSLKVKNGRPRNSQIESKGFNSGQIITSLDIKLPNFSSEKIPQFLKSYLSAPCKEFKYSFASIPNIQKLNTPEKISAFIYLITEKMRKGKSGKALKNVMVANDMEEFSEMYKEEIQGVIEYIDQAPVVNYLVESKRGKIANLVYLSNNGEDIQVTGKFESGESPLIISNVIMDDAIDYFNKKFGINIKTKTRDELKRFLKEIGSDEDNVDSIRAFVYEGEIYINTSNSDISDLFHEMTHIFLGRVKASDPKAYQRIISYYTKSPQFASNKNYIDKKYINFSEEDRIEECVADMIASNMAKNKDLSQDFKGEKFLEDFKIIFERMPKHLKEKQDSHPELGFDYYVTGNKELDSKMIRNMKISNLLKQQIKDGIIKQAC